LNYWYDEKSCNDMWKIRRAARLETLDKIQRIYQENGVRLMSGCRISKSGYNQQRLLLGYETFEEAQQRTLSKGIHFIENYN
jgi:hypothetical protein